MAGLHGSQPTEDLGAPGIALTACDQLVDDRRLNLIAPRIE
jgi:hypothetical protein